MSASTTRQITGVLLKPDATPFANSTVTIYRVKRRVMPTADAAIVDEVLNTQTGPGGEVSMSLVPGRYMGRIRLSDADRYFEFTVPDGAGPFLIQDLIDQSPVTDEKFFLLYELGLKARAWAENPEDEEVVPGHYSALHWAKKSESHVEHAEEWAQSPDPISTEAGGDGATDRSAKWWAGYSEQQAERAEDARDLAASYASTAGMQAEGNVYDSVVGMASIEVPEGINAIIVMGYSAAGDGRGGHYVRRETQPVVPDRFQSADGSWWERVYSGAPIVLFSTGQSNLALVMDYEWEPAPNLMVWNWNIDGSQVRPDLETGTAFVFPPSDKINFSWSFANEMAKLHPDSPVFLINVGVAARPISNWLPGNPGIDMFAGCVNQVTTALAQIGIDHVDMMLWWQGESDAPSPENWVNNFNTVHNRFRGQAWFPYTTPILMMGLSPHNAQSSQMVRYVTNAVCLDPDYRHFINLSSLPLGDFWDPNSTLHMVAEGYYHAGIFAFNAWRGKAFALMKGINVDPISGNIYIGSPGVPGNNQFSIRRDSDSAALALVAANLHPSSAGVRSDLATPAGTYRRYIQGNNAYLSWDGPGYLHLRSMDADGELAFWSGGAFQALLNKDGNFTVGGTTSAPYKMYSYGPFGFRPGPNVDPVNNLDVVFDFPNNTTIRIKAKGPDGIVRSASIALS